MAISKATASSIAPAAKGDLVAGSATNDAAVLGVGANDTVLTADSSTATGLKWATPGGGSALTLIEAGTITAAAAWNFGTVFTSTYDNYLVQIEGRTNSGARPVVTGFFRTSGTNNTNANYYAAASGRNIANTAIGWADNGSSGFNLGAVASLDRYALSLTVVNPNLALKTMVTGTLVALQSGQTDFGYPVFGGHFTVDTVFDSMGFSVASSDFTGRYKVYGLAN